MRAVTIVLGAFTLVVAGTALAASTETRSFSASDLPRILGPRPPASKGMAYQVSPGEDALCGAPSSFGLADLQHASPSDCPKTLVEKMTRAGFQRGLLKGWTVSRPTLSNAYAIGLVFRTADGAHAGLKVFSQGLKPMKDLGEEAFGFVHDNDGANYIWRLGNLVIGADIDCPDGSCSFDVARVTRIYAGAIDNQARKVRKR